LCVCAILTRAEEAEVKEGEQIGEAVGSGRAGRKRERERERSLLTIK
jgi:hypothetical protein